MAKLDANLVLHLAKERQVKYVRLQFTDLMGGIKNVEIPVHQLAGALEDGVPFDGSSIDGFSRIDESDMFLQPDPGTWLVFPWSTSHGQVARLICDVRLQDGTPFAGDPRAILKNAIRKLKTQGFSDLQAGMECEFFLLPLDKNGHPMLYPSDDAGYFDVSLMDAGENCRRDIVVNLQSLGLPVESSHHEAAPGQHEVDFAAVGALTAADNFITAKMVMKTVARDYKLFATFMPKPFSEADGSGLHIFLKLLKNQENCFCPPKSSVALSGEAKDFVAGLLQHARAISVVTNPLVNSYKRIVPGYDAPAYAAWSQSNPRAYVRVPEAIHGDTCVEVRAPDVSCNPYLAVAVILSAGMEGLESKPSLPAPVEAAFSGGDAMELFRKGIYSLPKTLEEALFALEDDITVQAALGEYAYQLLRRAKLQEWREYQGAVHPWEYQRYLHET